MKIRSTKIGDVYRCEEGSMKGCIYMVTQVDQNTVTVNDVLKLTLCCIYSSTPRFPIGHSYSQMETFRIPGLPKAIGMFNYEIAAPEIEKLFAGVEFKKLEFIPVKLNELQKSEKTVYIFKEAR